jgi:hypothetical protein
VLVLRPVVDQQDQAGGWQALDQAVQQRLGLGVDPVQILQDHERRPNRALAKEQPLDRLQGPLTALGRIERLPPWIVGGHVQQAQQGEDTPAIARSSASSLPRTFSRIVRVSSRSSMSK